MWIEHVFLGFLGLVCGLSVASGSFAIAVKLGIIPQMANKSGTAKHIMTYENVVILGGISGNLFSVFPDIRFPAGHVLLWRSLHLAKCAAACFTLCADMPAGHKGCPLPHPVRRNFLPASAAKKCLQDSAGSVTV